MKKIEASQFGLHPGDDVTEKLASLFDSIKNEEEDKTIFFEKGTYFINSQLCRQQMLYITNTVGDNEFSVGETPHLNAVPFYLNQLKNLTLDGRGAIFLIDGKVTNIALEGCENITIKNIEIRHAHPDMHELRVIQKKPLYVDFEIDRDTRCSFEDGTLYFLGQDYKTRVDGHALNAHWIGLIRKNRPDKLERVSHPLFGAVKMKDIGANRLRVYYLNTARFKTDDCFYLFDVRRQFAGIFMNQCENITLDTIKQRFNYSLALVAQDSCNIALQNSFFAPEAGSCRKMASVADFIQICMCRGNVLIKNNLFDGSGDDCLNVHGIHFKITEMKGNRLIVRFMHPQSHGFLPLRPGDTIAFINPETLLEHGKTVVEKAKLLNEYEIELTVPSTQAAVSGYVIEDVTACPDVLFAGNTLSRIITRGLLLTTRGKVLVENNHFISNSMSGVLLSDDAKNWYESGMCRDVTLQNNTFDYCGKTPILIKPENKQHAGAVHKNIRILQNTFHHYKGYGIRAKSSDNIFIKGNYFSSNKIMKSKNCSNVRREG